jgi:hypothetical protein
MSNGIAPSFDNAMAEIQSIGAQFARDLCEMRSTLGAVGKTMSDPEIIEAMRRYAAAKSHPDPFVRRAWQAANELPLYLTGRCSRELPSPFDSHRPKGAKNRVDRDAQPIADAIKAYRAGMTFDDATDDQLPNLQGSSPAVRKKRFRRKVREEISRQGLDGRI